MHDINEGFAIYSFSFTSKTHDWDRGYDPQVNFGLQNILLDKHESRICSVWGKRSNPYVIYYGNTYKS